jgi:uncharacterized protein YoaH (UPF0181 family)
MTVAAHKVLAAFNALDPDEQQQVAVEILRHSAATGELTDEALSEIAADVFRAYDAEESDGAQR